MSFKLKLGRWNLYVKIFANINWQHSRMLSIYPAFVVKEMKHQFILSSKYRSRPSGLTFNRLFANWDQWYYITTVEIFERTQENLEKNFYRAFFLNVMLPVYSVLLESMIEKRKILWKVFDLGIRNFDVMERFYWIVWLSKIY